MLANKGVDVCRHADLELRTLTVVWRMVIGMQPRQQASQPGQPLVAVLVALAKRIGIGTVGSAQRLQGLRVVQCCAL